METDCWRQNRAEQSRIPEAVVAFLLHAVGPEELEMCSGPAAHFQLLESLANLRGPPSPHCSAGTPLQSWQGPGCSAEKGCAAPTRPAEAPVSFWQELQIQAGRNFQFLAPGALEGKGFLRNPAAAVNGSLGMWPNCQAVAPHPDSLRDHTLEGWLGTANSRL